MRTAILAALVVATVIGGCASTSAVAEEVSLMPVIRDYGWVVVYVEDDKLLIAPDIQGDDYPNRVYPTDQWYKAMQPAMAYEDVKGVDAGVLMLVHWPRNWPEDWELELPVEPYPRLLPTKRTVYTMPPRAPRGPRAHSPRAALSAADRPLLFELTQYPSTVTSRRLCGQAAVEVRGIQFRGRVETSGWQTRSSAGRSKRPAIVNPVGGRRLHA